ncbi:unnamed protein product [Closterium sp. Yama58-4]|nr:unnamed protein product [Closterium sp. Yama58-4]
MLNITFPGNTTKVPLSPPPSFSSFSRHSLLLFAGLERVLRICPPLLTLLILNAHLFPPRFKLPIPTPFPPICPSPSFSCPLFLRSSFLPFTPPPISLSHPSHSHSPSSVHPPPVPPSPALSTQQPPSGAFPRRKLLLAVPYKKGFQQFVNITRTITTPSSSASASPANDTSSNESSSYSFSGFTIELFRLAVSQLPYDANYELVPFVGDDGDGADAPVGYDDMLQAVADEKFDGAIGDISVTQARSMLVDFTQPYMASAVSVIAYVPPSSSWWMALAPFTPSMWAAFLGLTIATGLITVFLECRQNPEFQGKLHELLQHALWFGYLSAFSFLEKPVRTVIARIVLALWLLVTLVVVTSYTANMTSIITVNMLTVPSLDVNSVINANNPIAYQAGSFIEGYLLQLGVQKHNMVPLNSAEEYSSALVAGRAKVVVDEDPYLDLLRANHCSMAQVKQPFSFLSMAFAFQKGSQLRRDISAAILHLTMTGELDALEEQYLLGGSRQCPDTLMPEAPAVLANENFWGLFVGYAVVSLACCLLYVGLLVFRGAMVARELSQQQVKSYNTHMADFIPTEASIEIPRQHTLSLSLSLSPLCVWLLAGSCHGSKPSHTTPTWLNSFPQKQA